VTYRDDLDKASKLKDDWNDAGGLAPTKEAVAACREFLDKGAVFPLPTGGVQLEAEAGQWHVVLTFQPDGTCTVIYHGR
jgi:hypothetical protein